MKEIYILDKYNNIIEAENTEANIIGSNYFDFSYDEILINILKDIFEKVRTKQKIFSTSYRCDNDNYVRYFDLNIIPLKGNQIKLEHILTKQIKRKTNLKNFKQSSKTYKMCAWCNKILYKNNYIEMEDAINEIKIFNDEGIPNFTHGICDSCKLKLENEIKSYLKC